MRVIDESTVERTAQYVREYQRSNGEAPSFRNIMNVLKFNSLCTVQRYVRVLAQRGILEVDDNGAIQTAPSLARGKGQVVPLVGVVTCGAPITAVENIESNFVLPDGLFGGGSLFMLRTKGDSMIEAGIQDGDLVVVRQQNHADYGDIVVALLEDEATVKRYCPNRTTRRIHLHPENCTMQDIIVDDCAILGVVSSVIHSF